MPSPGWEGLIPWIEENLRGIPCRWIFGGSAYDLLLRANQAELLRRGIIESAKRSGIWRRGGQDDAIQALAH